MISLSGYRVLDGEPPPYEAPLLVMSAGHFRFLTLDGFHTLRPQGRPDYQLLYMAGGCAEFVVDGQRHMVQEGQLVVYRPHEFQDYFYESVNKPEVFWVHFTGTEADTLMDALAMHGLHTVGTDARFGELIGNIIRELQLKRPLADELAAALLRELLVRLSRRIREGQAVRPRSTMVEWAVDEIERHFAEPLTVARLAAHCHVESCWFSRLFRRQMGQSPQQYLIQVRIAKARELLNTTDCAVGEVARLVGYENPLYFSRLFSRVCGCSPREYRQQGEIR